MQEHVTIFLNDPQLTNEAGVDIPLSPYVVDKEVEKHFLHIPLLSGVLEPGVTYKLHAESLASIFRDGRTNALYLSSYLTEFGDTKYISINISRSNFLKIH